MDLVIDALSCRRGGRPVFAGLSFVARAGEAVALRGPNGAGKSSLLRLLAGLARPAAGDARLGGRSLRDSAADYRDRVAYAGHLDAVKPQLTVAENAAFWARLLGAAPGAEGAALARFGLAPIADRPAAECSAGQKRRLGLARLLLAERPLWLLDEPTVSLDAASSRLVAELIGAHVAAGGIALVATHVDLGLPELRTLALAAPGAGPAAEPAAADPFLEGAW